MHILIIGSGGVGGYYGGLLAQSGHQVTFIARGAHLQALREHGLQVFSVHGDFKIYPVEATDTAQGIAPVDLALVCVKTYATPQAAALIQPAVGANTAVLSLQNGVDAAERIGAILGMGKMLAGATWIASSIEAPGVIRQVSQFRRIVLGELDGSLTPRLQTIAEALSQAGITTEISQDIRKVIWTKFLFIASISAIGSLTRLPIGETRHIPETRRLMVSLMQEVEALARKQGIALDDDIIPKTLEFVDNTAPHIKASMQRDIEASLPSELEALIGVIPKMGRELGVPTPAAEMVYAALLPVELAAQANKTAAAQARPTPTR